VILNASEDRTSGKRADSAPRPECVSRRPAFVAARVPRLQGPHAKSASVPIVFVLSDASPSQLEFLRTLETQDAEPYLKRGVWIWCLQTFLELRNRGLPVSLMSEPEAGAVNFMHVRQLSRQKPTPDAFFVSIQADYAAIPWTSANIVQNQLQADQKRSFWVPHWPHPALIPRSPARDRVECVAYSGNPQGLAGSEEKWSTALRCAGIEFRNLSSDAWSNYSDVDVLLGVRSFDRTRYTYKPPSKLLNAWHARIPLVAGFDSAFAQVGRPGCDYLRVRTFDEAIETIRLLRENADLYRAVVNAGAERALEYTRDRIGDAWERLLSGVIAARFAKWKENRFASRLQQQARYRTWQSARLVRSLVRHSLAAITPSPSGRREGAQSHPGEAR
jgi:hypothetical protein